jgi:hypothetical protein
MKEEANSMKERGKHQAEASLKARKHVPVD